MLVRFEGKVDVMEGIIQHILHPTTTMLHLLTGSLVMYILIGQDDDVFKKRVKVMGYGAFVAISPDIPKLLGTLLGHSIWGIPVLALIVAFPGALMLNISYSKLWLSTVITILFAAILIDFMGNGAHIFYPFIQKGVSFEIIDEDIWMVGLLLLSLSIGLLYHKGRPLLIIGSLFIAVFLGVKAYSKWSLEQTLYNKYEDKNVVQLTTYPSTGEDFSWTYKVETNKETISGRKSLFN
ncbi:hypothetical protein [Pontibacillus yanchengensis]|uniref:Hydrolase n=1 Tax=Pontibacillus yanchengensis Y32 TaxID=1385514 RepID=A0A0A2TBY9_9BACI|nr:hypothetical protein [Pontibacillus yanchengensis]KGP71928.1 hypothetical protein N782_14845 [Pontibacillus yanchengensis Y32]